MANQGEVSYCGLYCPNCGARCHLPQRASALIEEMLVGEYDQWGHMLEGFTPFWKFLHELADVSIPKRCREETCGNPECGLRQCAMRKGVEACPFCEEYPCEILAAFAQHNPTLIFDGRRMQTIGMAAWITEQALRRENGFCYGDIRCG
jgi:hypothetical protein